MAIKYTATLASGELVKRTSRERVYTHFWRVTGRTGSNVQGWAGSERLARAAANTTANSWRKYVNGDCTIEIVAINAK